MLFFSLAFGGREGNCYRKSQAEFPLPFVIKTGKAWHAPWSGRDPQVPGVGLEAGSASVQHAMRPEKAT